VKSSFTLTMLLCTSTSVSATKGYEHPQYYNNDPFTFCTDGVPEDCWALIDAATGSYTVTNQYCFNPVSAATYARVCPKAFNNFSSEGKSSSEDQDPANAGP
jgi:hypothetical protein